MASVSCSSSGSAGSVSSARSSPRSPSLGEVLTQGYYDVIARDGVLRGDISRVHRKFLEIGHPFVVQFNEAHEKNVSCGICMPSLLWHTYVCAQKRPSSMKSEKVKIVRDFNPDFFHFLKIHCNEVVAKLALDEEDTQVVCLADAHAELEADATVDQGINGMKVAPSGAQLHRLVVNSSPLYRGHCLLLLEAEMMHPQILSAQALLYACRTLTLRGARDDMLIGFNSLGAWASVNHLHMHVFLSGESMFQSGVAPIQHAPSKLYTTMQSTTGTVPVKVYKTTTYPLHAYVFTLKDSAPQHQVADSVAGAASDSHSSENRNDEWVCDLSKPPGKLPSYPPASHDFPPSSSTADRMCPPLMASRNQSPLSADLNLAFEHLASRAGEFVKQLQLLDVPHTVLAADGGRTIFVIPRRVQQSVNDGQLNIAFAESVGLPIVTSQHAFENITADYLLELYDFFCVSKDTESVLDQWLLETAETPSDCSFPSIQVAISEVLQAKASSQVALSEGTPIPGKHIDLPSLSEAKEQDASR